MTRQTTNAIALGAVVVVLATFVGGQRRRARTTPPPPTTQNEAAASAPKTADEGKKEGGKDTSREEAPVVTHHQVRVGARTLAYTATAGRLPIKNEAGDVQAQMFFVAYTVEGQGTAAARSLIFCFNGGPGAGSLWLHLGAIGPRRVKLLEGGQMPRPPFQVIDNEFTWLDKGDLVFIDPVGTGYSRATKPGLGKQFWGVQGDIKSVGEFIRQYLSRYQRWGAPLFLAGESYGTTRAAGLSAYLADHGIIFNGLILVSSVLNFETLAFVKGNDLPYILYLPSYTTSAWYHKKLAPELQADLQRAIRESEQWASTGYAEALAKGDRLSAAERQATIDQLSRFTGLAMHYIDLSDLRIEIFHFTKELLRDQRRTIGRIDSRFEGIDRSAASEVPDSDPSIDQVRPPFTAALNQYVRGELNYSSDLEYYALGGGFTKWDWGSASEGFPDTSEALRSAFSRNNYMKLFVASGYFDLATPFYATQYTLSHLEIDPSLRANISTAEYPAGHMMYIDGQSLAKLKGDVAGFIDGALR